jgi:hypothetical protein
MKVKFFRNAEAVEAPAAAPETDVVVEPQSQPAIDLPSDFMAQMAKSARLVNEGEEAPEYKAEVVADPTETEPVVATDSKPVKGQADTPAKPTDEPIVATQPIAAEPPTEVNWKEQLQKEPPAAILKELGYDERMVNFLEHWKSGGDITEYLKEVATDYTKMDAAELMRHQLRLEYPDATEEQLEVLYEDEVLHKYKMTDDYSEEEQRRGKLLLDAKVSKFRPEFVSRQQSKLLPPAPEKAAVEPMVDPVIEQQRKLVDDSRKSVLDSPYYRKVLTDNKITFGEGGEAFNFPVDANELPDILYNGEKFVQSLFKVGQDANGDFTLQADPEHQMLVAATAKYGKQLFVELAKHYKALGSKKAIDPIENPSTIQTTQSNVPPEPQLSEIAQMAKYGKVT